MEFNCPSCETPHAFPDDQIPPSGIVVACTHCSFHITLDPDGVRGEDNTAAMSMPEGAGQPAGGRDSGFGHTPVPGPSPGAPAGQGWSSSGPALDATAALSTDDVPPPPQSPPQGPPPGPPSQPQPHAQHAPGQAAPGARPSKSGRFSSAMGAAMGAASRAFDEATGEPMAAEEEVPAGLNYPGFAPGGSDKWTWRDLPRAFMGLLDSRRLIFTTAGLWLALVAFGLLKWLGGWLGSKVALLGTVLDVVAWAALVSLFALVTAVMSYVCHQVVIERRPSSIKAGIGFVQAWLKSVVGTPLAFAAVIAAAVLVEAVLAGIGRIPFVGPIVWGLTAPVTAVLMVASGLVAVALAYALPLYVPVIYNEKTGPVETLKRLAGMFQAHGLRLVGYLLLSVVSIGFALTVTVFPALRLGRLFTDGVVPQAMGGNLGGVFMEAPSMFKGSIAMLVMPTGGVETNIGHTLGGLLGGIGATVLPALVLALVVLVHYTAGCIIYGIVTGRRKV